MRIRIEKERIDKKNEIKYTNKNKEKTKSNQQSRHIKIQLTKHIDSSKSNKNNSIQNKFNQKKSTLKNIKLQLKKIYFKSETK